jgi:hypothetical protein
MRTGPKTSTRMAEGTRQALVSAAAMFIQPAAFPPVCAEFEPLVAPLIS